MKKLYSFLIASMFLAACSQAAHQNHPTDPIKYQNLGPAPELSNTIWINSTEALRLADLRGKVVLLDMWTFG